MPTFSSSENFLAQAPAEKAVRPRGFYKAIVLDVLSVISGLSVGLTYRLYLNSQTGLTPSILCFLFFSLVACVQVSLARNLKRRAFVLILEVLAVTVFFYDLAEGPLTTLFGLLLFFFVWGEINSRREIINTISPNYFRVGREKLKKLVTGVALAAALIYLPQVLEKEYLIPRSFFQDTFDWSVGVVAKLYPEVKLQGTVGEFIDSLASYNMNKLPEFIDYPISDQKKFVDLEIDRLTNQFTQSLRKKIDLQQKSDDLIYEYTAFYLDSLRSKFSREFRLIWVALLFLILRSIGAFFVIIAAGLFFIVTQLLLSLGLIYLAGETRTKETLIF